MKEEPKHIWRIRRAKPDRLMSKAGESEPLSNCVGDFQCVEIYGEKPCGICCEPHYLPIHGSQQDWGTLVEWTACFDCGKFGHGMECSHAGRGFSFACEGCYKLFETGLPCMKRNKSLPSVEDSSQGDPLPLFFTSVSRPRFEDLVMESCPVGVHKFWLDYRNRGPADSSRPACKPWNENRIVLKYYEDKGLREHKGAGYGYINASRIDLGRVDETFIATQGPIGRSRKRKGSDPVGRFGTMIHFWEMCWQENVGSVFMLTRCWEERPGMPAQENCAPYFPIFEGSVKSFGGWGKVTCISLKEGYPWGKESRLQIRLLKLNKRGQEKSIMHYLLRTWPDQGIPRSTSDQIYWERGNLAYGLPTRCADGQKIPKTSPEQRALLYMLQLSRRCAKGQPRVVHCRDGAGLTGTFIALDHLLAELADGNLDFFGDKRYREWYEQRDPVFNTVQELKYQRVGMVETKEQFQFIYDVLQEKWEDKFCRGYPERLNTSDVVFEFLDKELSRNSPFPRTPTTPPPPTPFQKALQTARPIDSPSLASATFQSPYMATLFAEFLAKMTRSRRYTLDFLLPFRAHCTEKPTPDFDAEFDKMIDDTTPRETRADTYPFYITNITPVLTRNPPVYEQGMGRLAEYESWRFASFEEEDVMFSWYV